MEAEEGFVVGCTALFRLTSELCWAEDGSWAIYYSWVCS